jgi:hypothetical protein
MSFGALDLGTWIHAALASWYERGLKRAVAPLSHLFMAEAESALVIAKDVGAPDHIVEKAEELIELGVAMTDAYQEYYHDDPDVSVLDVEIPLDFSLGSAAPYGALISHLLKPDMVYRSMSTGYVWLMEHKSAAQIRTEHLAIDDQARPYGAMVEPALRKMGLLKSDDRFQGIMYNFLRKTLPDERPRDAQGRALNKNGSVSARQPAVAFVRKGLTMTRPAKIITLDRVRAESFLIAAITARVRSGNIDPDSIHKTPHHSCPKFCDYFAICSSEEDGVDITDMVRVQFVQKDPYTYYGDTTTESTSFEMG